MSARRGFTLLEVMVAAGLLVVAILATLAATTSGGLLRNSSRQSLLVGQLRVRPAPGAGDHRPAGCPPRPGRRLCRPAGGHLAGARARKSLSVPALTQPTGQTTSYANVTVSDTFS